MSSYLGEHPGIFMARKEMHHFGADLEFGRRFYRRSARDYRAEFSGWKGEPVAGEASVWYLYSKTAAREIREFNPEARILILLREPAEMLHSLYSQFRFDGNESLPTFEEALEAEGDRRAGRRIPRQAYLAQGLRYREAARYAGQVERYLEEFGPDRVKVILQEDFASDTAKVYRETLEFLGMDPAPRPASWKVINGNKRSRSPMLRAILSEPWLRGLAVAARRWAPRGWFAALQRIEERVWKMNTLPAPRTNLSPEVRTKLKREFESEVESLGRLLGRDLAHWSFGQRADDGRRTPRRLAGETAKLVSVRAT